MSIVKNLPFEWLVGLRYTRAGKRSGRNSFISFISLISMAGIGLGTAALIVVLSVMNGFEKEVTTRMLSVLAHVEVFDLRGSMPDWQQRAREAFANPQVRGAAPFVETEGMLIRDDILRPSVVRGVLPEAEKNVSEVGERMREGSLDTLKPGQFNIVLGAELARALKVKVGQTVTLARAQAPGAGGAMQPRVRSLTVTGIFEVGHNQFDSGLALINITDAEQLAGVAAPSGLRLRLADMQRAPEVARQLKQTMPGDLFMRDWTSANSTWFAAVKSQKNMMFIILTMIIAVAAFNLVATLVMTVTDKQADIAILRTLGASPASIMKIFMIQGGLTGVLGTGFGIALGSVLAVNIHIIVPFIEGLFGMHFLSKDIYLISSVPSDLRLSDVTNIGVISVLLAFVATIYPSWRGARVKPAQALRYE
ncbi:lipoprotein-releasing ABC transporter permease subunit [Oxalobacteraceae bacterium OTU3CINTB1]|nr:lipoprotein-releasing ABC transporter permease subunit [Oxalobacteraceae bacterium OTU3CINTB1]